MLPRQTKSTEWFFIGGLGVFGEKWVVSVQGQGLRVGRQVGIFRQNVVQDADMLDAAFRHQVEEVVLDDGDVVGGRKVPHEHLRDDFKRAVGRVETEQNLPARPCGNDDADARTLGMAAAWLDGYFAGEAPSPAPIPLAPAGTDFQKHVWEAMATISYGATRTYGHLAATLRGAGIPASAQAIGGAVGRNPLLLIRPCHRVVAATSPGGYAAGGDAKAWLLAHEEATASSAN